MPFFQEDAANVVQLISLPLEVIGCSFAFIEVFTPKTADRIENWFDHTQKEIKAIVEWAQGKTPEEDEPKMNLWVRIEHASLTVRILFYSLLFLLGPFAILSVIAIIFSPIATGLGLALIIAIFIFTTLVITWMLGLFGKTIALFNRITNGYALGAIGVILASIGVLGEVYQVLTIFLAN